MQDRIALAIWVLGMGVQVCFVGSTILRKAFFRYFFLNLYIIFCVSADLLRQFVLNHYGYSSAEYVYTYYYTDCLLTVALFIAVISLASHVFQELNLVRYVQLVAVLLLLGTAGFSYAVVAQSKDRLSTTFALELSQNLYFVGLVLTYLLWGAVLKLHETRTRLVQMILSLGLYFSAYAGSYALMNMHPESGALLKFAAPMIGCFLPVSWALTILRYSEESRLTPSRLVAVPR